MIKKGVNREMTCLNQHEWLLLFTHLEVENAMEKSMIKIHPEVFEAMSEFIDTFCHPLAKDYASTEVRLAYNSKPNPSLCQKRRNCFFYDQLAEGVIENLLELPSSLLRIHLKFLLVSLLDSNPKLKLKLVSRL